MTRIEKILQSAQEYTSSGDYSPSLKDCFIAGVKWADENPKNGLVSLDKVCEWIADAYLYGVLDKNCDAIINDFKKAMEE